MVSAKKSYVRDVVVAQFETKMMNERVLKPWIKISSESRNLRPA
jgi:hypothetical protein